MDRKFYVINYKETTIDENSVQNVECGSFDYGFESLEEAKKSLVDVAQNKISEFSIGVVDRLSTHWSDGDEYVTIGFGGDTYEYWVYLITIPNVECPF